MHKNQRAPKTTEQMIRERKEKRRIKSERFIAKLEKIERAKEAAKQTEPAEIPRSPTPAGRQYTLSIAIPCSVIGICQSLEQKCYLASMVARCSALFYVEEIIVFNDTTEVIPMTPTGEYALIGKRSHSALTFASILQYLECPPHLRRFFFPHKKEFDLANLMNPLNIPHHQTEESNSVFREGIVTKTTPKPGRGSFVNVGLHREVQVDRLLEEGVRVTVKMETPKEKQKKLHGTIVSPSTPRQESRIYWGYSVRIAKSFADVFNGSPFEEKYDFTLATSEHGRSVDTVQHFKPFKHGLIVFGGVHGIEAVMEADEEIPHTNPGSFFTAYLNTCPNRGSRTIRTEEDLFITLSTLQTKFA